MPKQPAHVARDLLYACALAFASPPRNSQKAALLMISALVASTDTAGTSSLAADLVSVGIHVLGATDRRNVVRDVVRHAPDVLVWWENSLDDGSLLALAALAATAPVPVAVFTADPDADRIARAVEAGAHAYVVNGYSVQRLRSVLHVAQARFRREQQLRTALEDVTHRFEERKLVDRAKGILMRATQMSEDDAFRLLRKVSMRDNQRVGQVSRQVIDAAHYADAVNRAGQLRMLSQRIVKLQTLLCTGTERAGSAALLAQSVQRVDANLEHLGRALSKATFGDLLDAVHAVWGPLKAGLGDAPETPRLARLDELAEGLLKGAEQLTTSLEGAGMLTTLHVIIVCGRQRMLSQRLAKQALLAALLPGEAGQTNRTGGAQTVKEFEETLVYLNRAPLSSADIRASLDSAGAAWQQLTGGLQQADQPAGRLVLASASEALLDAFDRLSELYERSMQILIG